MRETLRLAVKSMEVWRQQEARRSTPREKHYDALCVGYIIKIEFCKGDIYCLTCLNCPIPRSPLANAGARHVVNRAPPIANNAPRHLDHLVAACLETRSMKRARADGYTIAVEEYARALLRKQTVASEIASSVYRANGTPIWAITLRDDLREDMNALRDDLRAEARRRQEVPRKSPSYFHRN
jgi:hypothetical protein